MIYDGVWGRRNETYSRLELTKHILVLGYIIIKSLRSLVNAAAFGLLWLEQYSLLIDYFDNITSSASAFMGSLIVRLAEHRLFGYAICYALSGSRISDMKIETGKET
jgi:hypothetical protein